MLIRYAFLSIMFLSTNLYSQIIGNYSVNDLRAIKLDSLNKQKLIGEWVTKDANEFINGETREINIQYWRINFDKDSIFFAKKCEDCLTREKGFWEIANEKVINITIHYDHKRGTYELEGVWVVYKLTDKELTLVRVLTSSGDWKKYWHFEKVQR